MVKSVHEKGGSVNPKEVAARKAVQYVQSGMTMGIGTGSTSEQAILALGERIKTEGLSIRAVPTSDHSRELAESLGIVLVDFTQFQQLDLTIDGADEVDSNLNLIKGGGGALLREKIVASASRELIIICDDTKIKPLLGTHPLPVAVVPFGFEATRRRLLEITDTVTLRTLSPHSTAPFVTDDHLYILDLQMNLIENPAALEEAVRSIVGVVEVGLFIRMASRVIVGFEDGHTEELLQK